MDVRKSTKRITVISLVMFLSGCSLIHDTFYGPHDEKIIKVKVPVPGECKIEERPDKPVYEIHHLTNDDNGNYRKIGRAYVKSFKQCQTYSKQQDNVFDALEKE